MEPSRDTDSLSRTLANWRLVAPRNPQFRTAVWSRIGSQAAALPWREYARRHSAAMMSAIALALLAGGLLGREQARARTAEESARMAAAYVQGLDARLMPMP